MNTGVKGKVFHCENNISHQGGIHRVTVLNVEIGRFELSLGYLGGDDQRPMD